MKDINPTSEDTEAQLLKENEARCLALANKAFILRQPAIPTKKLDYDSGAVQSDLPEKTATPSIGAVQSDLPEKTATPSIGAVQSDLPEKTATPSIGAMASSLGTSLKKWVGSGLSNSTQEVIDMRLDICKGCELWDSQALNGTGRCRKCGCSTWAKIRMATEKCPIGKWGPVLNHQQI
jgi:hypothetical protein